MALRTDYKDALFEALRRYQIIHNEDGTISLLDVTRYTQTGDKFGANDVNAITEKSNNNENRIKDAEGNIINLQKEKANKTEVDDLLKGKSNTNHTHNYAGSDSAGGKANSAKVADSVAWGNVSSKPSSYPPSGHNHDDRYYTETEINTKLNGKSNTTHTHDERYYTETEVNTLLNNKSNTNHTHAYIPTSASCNKNWNWSGQAGQPSWIWGSNDGTNMFVYNPSNFSVNYANSAGSVAWGNVQNIPGLSSGYVRNGQRMGSTIGDRATAEGISVTASGDYAHGEGYNTKASGSSAHTEGNSTTASGYTAHAEGYYTTASGDYSHAGGYETIASGTEAVAYGKGTQATGWCSFAIGKYNKETATATNSINSPFMIGKGTDNANRANAFRVHNSGIVYSTGAYNTTGADYAEYFEWLDKNLSNEDRVGYFVTLDGEKIRIATEKDDYILGIVSATPSVIGNSYDDQWIGREIRDEWGRIIYEEIEIQEERDEEGNIIQEAHKEMQPKLNKDYDNTKEYIGRSQRKEWDAIGMLGQLLVRDDGTCKVNEYCKCGKEGVATAAETGYRVLARVSDNIIKVLFR